MTSSDNPFWPNHVPRDIDPVVEYYKAGIDTTLLDYMLSLSIDERMQLHADRDRLVAELRAGLQGEQGTNREQEP